MRTLYQNYFLGIPERKSFCGVPTNLLLLYVYYAYALLANACVHTKITYLRRHRNMQTKRKGRAPIPPVVSQVIKLKVNLFCFFFLPRVVPSLPLQAIKISGLLEPVKVRGALMLL